MGWPVTVAMSSKSLSAWSTVSPASSPVAANDGVRDGQSPMVALLGQKQLHVDRAIFDRRGQVLDGH